MWRSTINYGELEEHLAAGGARTRKKLRRAILPHVESLQHMFSAYMLNSDHQVAAFKLKFTSMYEDDDEGKAGKYRSTAVQNHLQ